MEASPSLQNPPLLSMEQPVSRWSRLGTRMILSYIVVTFTVVLGLEILVALAISIGISTYVLPNAYLSQATQTAQYYAFASTLQSRNAVLNPQSTFQNNQPFSITLPGKRAQGTGDVIAYTASNSTSSQAPAFALLLRPDGSILASSYPRSYHLNAQSALLLQGEATAIRQSLTGNASTGEVSTPMGRMAYAVETVWNAARKPIGAVYVQFPETAPYQNTQGIVTGLLHIIPVSMLLLLVIMMPVGITFGTFTMRNSVRRLHRLVHITTDFTQGNYKQRITVGRRDEVGLLERHFNTMAAQLEESIAIRQKLAEQNARLAERSRISRDLHDSVKQQVFAIAMQVAAALSLLDVKREAARQHLVEAEALTYQTQQELTALIQELRPSILREKGLSLVLSEYIQAWSRQNTIAVKLEIHETMTLPLALEDAYFRVAQESLSNIARHSHARHVEVLLKQEQDEVCLMIADDGCGFDAQAISPTSVGLNSMRERMEELDGILSVVSSPGQGTSIEVRCMYGNRQTTVQREVNETGT